MSDSKLIQDAKIGIIGAGTGTMGILSAWNATVSACVVHDEIISTVYLHDDKKFDAALEGWIHKAKCKFIDFRVKVFSKILPTKINGVTDDISTKYVLISRAVWAVLFGVAAYKGFVKLKELITERNALENKS